MSVTLKSKNFMNILDTKELVEYMQRNPSDLKLGKDKSYFYDFYAFLCN